MISAKANSVRGFLQHNSCKCPRHVKCSSYTTYVWPILDYACGIWAPYHQHNIAKIEMTQGRAVHYDSNYDRTASVTDISQDLQWETLQNRHNKFVSLLFLIQMDIYNQLIVLQEAIDYDLSNCKLELTHSV